MIHLCQLTILHGVKIFMQLQYGMWMSIVEEQHSSSSHIAHKINVSKYYVFLDLTSFDKHDVLT